MTPANRRSEMESISLRGSNDYETAVLSFPTMLSAIAALHAHRSDGKYLVSVHVEFKLWIVAFHCVVLAGLIAVVPIAFHGSNQTDSNPAAANHHVREPNALHGIVATNNLL